MRGLRQNRSEDRVMFVRDYNNEVLCQLTGRRNYSGRQEIPRLLWKPNVHTVFTRVDHCSLSCANWSHSKSAHLWFILILSSLYPYVSVQSIIYISLVFSARYMPRPSHSLWCTYSNTGLFGGEYELWNEAPHVQFSVFLYVSYHICTFCRMLL
jgi:hypothetical protein